MDEIAALSPVNNSHTIRPVNSCQPAPSSEAARSDADPRPGQACDAPPARRSVPSSLRGSAEASDRELNDSEMHDTAVPAKEGSQQPGSAPRSPALERLRSDAQEQPEATQTDTCSAEREERWGTGAHAPDGGASTARPASLSAKRARGRPELRCQWAGDPLLQLRDALLCAMASVRPELATQLAGMGVCVTGDAKREILKRSQFLVYYNRTEAPPPMERMRELRLVELLDAVRKEAGLEALHLPCILLLRQEGWSVRASLVGMLPDPPVDIGGAAFPALPANGATAATTPAAPWGEAAPSATDASDGAMRPASVAHEHEAATTEQDSVHEEPT